MLHSLVTRRRVLKSMKTSHISPSNSWLISSRQLIHTIWTPCKSNLPWTMPSLLTTKPLRSASATKISVSSAVRPLPLTARASRSIAPISCHTVWRMLSKMTHLWTSGMLRMTSIRLLGTSMALTSSSLRWLPARSWSAVSSNLNRSTTTRIGRTCSTIVSKPMTPWVFTDCSSRPRASCPGPMKRTGHLLRETTKWSHCLPPLLQLPYSSIERTLHYWLSMKKKHRKGKKEINFNFALTRSDKISLVLF